MTEANVTLRYFQGLPTEDIYLFISLICSAISIHNWSDEQACQVILELLLDGAHAFIVQTQEYPNFTTGILFNLLISRFGTN